ncbi:DUF4244 domain-containing protein [Actinocrispum wychmicini]|uniref:Uncharacterized protein DUF4244 n=1 Tax=Actinocrispum wychmicini TaxID=1213861 RepID=A0A4R2JY94_9PSEU|nr:DUF4244 domain-containing protein [Actinocrispum wychmicini]TCO64277.1 uncharacterized protein DUF4244 [Actinocrispum wychmicini]
MTSDKGMSTAEYAIGTIAAVALAGILYAVLSSDQVVTAITEIIRRAFTVSF